MNVPSTVFVSASPTCDTNAYATGELVGGKLTFSNVFRLGTPAGFLCSVNMIDKAAQAVDFDLVLFDSDPSATTFTDQAAFDIADADLSRVLCVVNLGSSTRFAFADNSVHFIGSLYIPIRSTSATGRAIYGALVSRGAPTFAASTDVTIKLGISQD